MGMYNDHVSAGRSGWTYTYTGMELLPYAVKMYKEFLEKEKDARNKIAEYMKDMSVSHNDPKVVECKKDIEKFGMLKEQCEVFKHEFARDTAKKYELGLGDVTFFGLTVHVPNDYPVSL